MRWKFATIVVIILILACKAAFGQGVFVNSYRFGGSTGNDLLDGLQAYWKFDEASGAPQDSSGNARHLTEYGTVDSATGKIVNARYHDSAENDDYFGIASAAWNTFGSGDFSIAFWFRAAAPAGVVDDQILVAKADRSTGVSWAITIDNGSYTYGNAVTFSRSTDGSDLNFGSLLVLEFNETITGGTEWYFLCMTRSGNNFTIYLAKQDEATVTRSDTDTEVITLFDNSTVPLTVGSWLNSGAVDTALDSDADIDELGIWNSALSACQITKLFNAGFGRQFSTFDNNPCL